MAKSYRVVNGPVMYESNGVDYCVHTGEIAENVPADSLSWLLEDGVIQDADLPWEPPEEEPLEEPEEEDEEELGGEG